MTELTQRFQNILGSNRVLSGTDLKTRFEHIWHMDRPLTAKAVLLPQTTLEVSKIMKVCSEYVQPVVVHGGLTNLVGSTETNEDEVVISMEKMNRIVEVDPENRTTTVQAGVILESIHSGADQHDLLFPLNFGAKGSAQIGGAIATNAGGLNVMRYGMTRNLILGLEVVLPDGRIMNSMKKIVKDNSGYDLKQLFIGAEGTLGVITQAVLRLKEKPSSRCSAFMALKGYEKVVSLLKHMDKGLAGTLSGFELICQPMYTGMTKSPGSLRAPLPQGYPYYVLLESRGSNQEVDQHIMESLGQEALEENLIEDAVFAFSQADHNWFWSIREDVSQLILKDQIDQHFDVSIPTGAIGSYISEVRNKLLKLKEVKVVYPFGHIADGNIHFIVGKSSDSSELTKKVNDIVYNPLYQMQGSVSAEHGVGLHKKEFMHFSKTEVEIEIMKSVKYVLDPLNIMNRGKIFS